MMVYNINTKKFEFGDNKFEEALDKLGLARKGIKTGSQETLIYETERQEKLTDKEISQIMSMDGVYSVEFEI